ncbi:MAG: NADH-quinone oxidoreductase subunit M [Tepidisphaera sp.]|nr:NADH-quinone oxidoreductase subunit M [Tepidisphaera sp.]
MNQWLLILAMLTPLASALGVAVLPAARAKTVAMYGTLVALVFVLYAGFGVFSWEQSGYMQLGMDEPIRWIPSLGLEFQVGVDGISMMLVMLTALLGPICVISSFTAIKDREKTYYAWLLVLQAAMTGVFCARDLILFYICFEFTLVPMFILISVWGSTNRKKAAIKFFLYTFTGSVIALAGLVYVAWFNVHRPGIEGHVNWTFNIQTLAFASSKWMSLNQQTWVMFALLAGFAVKVPLFPVHTWLPLAHTEAPTAGSVILAGVLLKLGTYALIRFVLPFVPAAVVAYAPLIGALCIVGIIYGGLICWVQTDVKKLVAYSSVAHLGFCVLGMFALNHAGIEGSVLYMINHGLSTGALFLLIGMIYERYHTRSMKELGGLAAKMPVWATFMVFFTMASVGLPGLNGFVSEFLCVMGTYQASTAWGSGVWHTLVPQVGTTPGELGPWYAIIAGTGMIIAAMYLLYMLGKVVWGPLRLPAGHDHHGGHDAKDDHGPALPTDLSMREIGVLVPLAVLCVALGVYPKPLLEALKAPTDSLVQAANAGREKIGVEATPGERAAKGEKGAGSAQLPGSERPAGTTHLELLTPDMISPASGRPGEVTP